MAEHIKIYTDDNQALSGSITYAGASVAAGLEQSLVIMVHGFPGNKESHDNVFSDLSSSLKKNGYSSLSFDCRGCGKSGGTQEDYSLSSARRDIAATIRWARMKGYQKFIFIGEGLGAILPLMDFDDLSSCFVMLWPILDLPHYAQTMFDSKNIEEQWKKAGYIIHEDTRVGTEFIYELENTSLVSTLQKVTKPTLVMHGVKDEVAPIEKLDVLRSRIGSRRVEITSFEGGIHGLPQENHRQSMIYHVLQFIEKYA